MKAYRIKHLPTGLYYRPSTEVKVTIYENDAPTNQTTWVKSNLSKKGKAYTTKPSLKWLGDIYYNHLIPISHHDDLFLISSKNKGCICEVVEAEWQIEEL